MKQDTCSLAAAVIEAEPGRESFSPRHQEILVPIDFSEPSLNALRYARALAAGDQAHVTLLNVVEEPGSFRTLDAVGQQRARHQHCAGRLRELADRELGPKVVARIEIREGKPSVEIARLAIQRHVDLIIVGRHEHQGLRQWLQGHTASRLSKQAPCPVLLIKGDHHLN